MRILINDGLIPSAIAQMEASKHEVKNIHVAPSQLVNYINTNNIEALIVRSATQVTRELLEACSSLKLVVRAGTGLDNIDIVAADELGVKVENTPGVSSRSVAELVMAHIFTGYRHLHDANRNMPLDGDSRFNQLKKSYAHAHEVQNKTLEIIGFGSIGKEVAKLAYANGMHVITIDRENIENKIPLRFADGQEIVIKVPMLPLEEVLEKSDIISIHIPAFGDYFIGSKEIDKMKTGAGLINTARGGLLDEKAALDALEKDKLSFVALDTFENEPKPYIQTLMHPGISLSPHVGGTTVEAQERIGESVVHIINTYPN